MSTPNQTKKVDALKVIIAEDEPLAAEALIEWVQAHPKLEFIGHASDGLNAVALCAEMKPDLLLLDINMPGQSGLQVARKLIEQQSSTSIIFTTAYDEHALTAFELHAIDYLLKPFSIERFNEAVEHALNQHSFKRSSSDVAGGDDSISAQSELLARLDSSALDSSALAGNGNEPLTRIMVRDQGKIFPVKVEQVEYLKSDTKYTAIAYQGRQFLVRLALHAFEDRLDKSRFLKLQRSCIVNLDFVESMTPDEMSQYVVKMTDGTMFTASRDVSKLLRSQSL
jgi:two-component system, LytTR family, response regulator